MNPRNVKSPSSTDNFGDIGDILMKFPSGSITAKSVFLEDKRFLFVAGLEGTGHHAFVDLMNTCRKKKGSICIPDCSISSKLSLFTSKSQSGLFVSQDVRNTMSNILAIDRLLLPYENKTGSFLVPFGLEQCRDTGTLSYPMYERLTKVMDHPDVGMIAMMAERHKLDLRVILLRRSAHKILYSAFRRNFGGYLEPLVIINNADILYGQLKSIDKRFIHCVNIDDLLQNTRNMTEQVSSIVHFIHPKLVEDVDLFVKHFRPTTNETALKNAAWNDIERSYFDYMLQKKLNRFDEFC